LSVSRARPQKRLIPDGPRRYPNGGRLYGGVKNYVGTNKDEVQTKRDDFTGKRQLETDTGRRDRAKRAYAECRQASTMVTTYERGGNNGRSGAKRKHRSDVKTRGATRPRRR